MGNLLDIFEDGCNDDSCDNQSISLPGTLLGDSSDGCNSSCDTPVPVVNSPVPWSRRIDTQHPLQGGGDFSQNRIHSIPPATDEQDGYLTKEDHQLLGAIGGGGTNSRIISGSTTWSGVGLTFDWTDFLYIILGIPDSSTAIQHTSVPADPILPRIDTFYVGIGGTTGIITGIPALNPVKPQVDPATQLETGFVLIPAGATTPGGITNTMIYNENIESVFNSDITGSNSASTINPYSGTLNVRFPSFTNGKFFQFTLPSHVTLQEYEFIKFSIYISSAFTPNTRLALSIYNGLTLVVSGFSATVTTYGFDRNLTGTWQVISIPVSSIAFSADTFVNRFVFKTIGTTGAPVQFDYFYLQAGNTGNPSASGVLSFNTRTGHVIPEEGDYKVPVSTFSALPVVGNPAKLYITLDTKFLYHWNGSSYDQIGGGGGGGTTVTYIEVVIGSAAADALGLVDGETVYTDVTMTNRQVEVERNGLPLPSIPWNGNDHFTKVFAEDHLEFANGLIDGELIKIKIL